MTQFIATPGVSGVFKQSFLQQLVSIHFPSGDLLRVSFTASGPNQLAAPTVEFPFGTLTEPVQNLVISAGGQVPAIVDPPSPDMIKSLVAWSVFSDEGNFVYYNTSKVQSRYGQYSPVVIRSPSLNGIPPFSTTKYIVWFYRATLNPPTGPLDPALTVNGEGGVLAIFDPLSPVVYDVSQILDFINGCAEGTLSPGVGGVPDIPIGDGGDAGSGSALVSALAGGSKIEPSAAGPNTYLATEVSTNPTSLNAGWGLLANLFAIKNGALGDLLASVGDFDVGADGGAVDAVTITLDVDENLGTLTETKT